MNASEHAKLLSSLHANFVRQIIPRRYWQGFDGYLVQFPENAIVKEAAIKWAAGFTPRQERGLVLGGQVGCGKSHIGCAILKSVIERGITNVAYQNVADFFDLVRASWGERDNSPDLLKKEFLSNDLVFFDDLGAEAQNDYEVEMLYRIFDVAYRELKPTLIVSTNYKFEILAKRMGKGNGERIVSRLGSLCVPLGKFPKKDMREHNPNETNDPQGEKKVK